MPRWVRSGVAAILAAVAVILTAYPPPQLPLRWLPAVSALILAGMLFWSRREQPAIPPEHAAVLRGLGAEVISNLNSKYPIQFSGTALESQQLRQAFRAHFPKFATKLDKWDAVATSWREAQLAIDHAAQEMSKANDFQSGTAPLYAVAMAHVNGINPVVVPYNEQPMPDKTTALLYGQNQIAVLADPSAQQLAAKKNHYQNLLGAVGRWPEVQNAQRVLLVLQALAKELSPEAQQISMSHNLTVASKCPICPKS